LIQPLRQPNATRHRIQFGYDETILRQQQVRTNHPGQFIPQGRCPLNRHQFGWFPLIQHLGHPSRRTPLGTAAVQLIHRLVELMKHPPQRLDL
jgi:hypothetical protein